MDPSTGLSMVQDQIAANNSWNAEQAQKQMDFQERMSNTAHAREVADLKASGLNPVLSAKLGGASTPSGAMAQSDPSATSALVNMIDKLIDVTQTQAHGNYYSAKGNAEGEDDFTAKDIGSLVVSLITGKPSSGTATAIGKTVKGVVDFFTSGKAKETANNALSSLKNAGSNVLGFLGQAYNTAKEKVNDSMNDWKNAWNESQIALNKQGEPVVYSYGSRGEKVAPSYSIEKPKQYSRTDPKNGRTYKGYSKKAKHPSVKVYEYGNRGERAK